MTSTDHLPECLHDDQSYGLTGLCICNELRACEQRVARQWYELTLQSALGIVAGLYPFGYERLMRSLKQIEGP